VAARLAGGYRDDLGAPLVDNGNLYARVSLTEVSLLLPVEEADAAGTYLGAAVLARLALINIDDLAGLIIDEGVAADL
jgi:hypothetical protein